MYVDMMYTYINTYMLIFYIHTYAVQKCVNFPNTMVDRITAHRVNDITGMYVCLYVCMHVCMYVCMYACMCKCI